MIDVTEILAYKESSAKENTMSDLSMSMFLNKDAFEAAKREETLQEAEVASRVKAAAVVTKLQKSGCHWTFTAKLGTN